jgi:hypothetical protein
VLISPTRTSRRACAISINTTYDETDATTYASVGGYAQVPLADLVPYSLSGAPGTTQLTSLQLHVDPTAIAVGGLQPTVTGCVRENDPGPAGEWRNGALTVRRWRSGRDDSNRSDDVLRWGAERRIRESPVGGHALLALGTAVPDDRIGRRSQSELTLFRGAL